MSPDADVTLSSGEVVALEVLFGERVRAMGDLGPKTRKLLQRLRLLPPDEPVAKPTVAVAVNINNEVEVELTERGAQVLMEDRVKAGASVVQVPRVGDRVRFPLWELMQIFGPELFMGSPNLFTDNEVKLAIEAP